ncbi:MAG: cytidylate kinase-like family protein [Clostridia bacterium]|nr:cytidylate kinase-like family protein [Clostridia bacterium]
MSNIVITIARGFGSGGRTIGKMLANRLDIHYYDGELLRLASEESGINIELFGKADEQVKTNLFKRYNRTYDFKLLPPDSSEYTSTDNLFNYQAKIIRNLAETQDCVIIGRCSDYVLKDQPGAIRLLIYADRSTCIKNVTELYGVLPKEADDRIDELDRARAAYYKYHTGKTWDDPANYDLCINTSKYGFETTVEIILSYMRTLGYTV